MNASKEMVLICKRYPPQPTSFLVPVGNGNVQISSSTAWPAISKDDSCGEFQAKLELTS